MLFADNLYSYQNQLVFISLDPFLTEVSRETGGGGGGVTVGTQLGWFGHFTPNILY